MSDEQVKRLTLIIKKTNRDLEAAQNAFGIYVKQNDDLRRCLNWFVSDNREMSLEQAIKLSKAVLKGKNLE